MALIPSRFIQRRFARRPLQRALVCTTAIALLAGCGSIGTRTRFADQLDEDTVAWQEIAVQLPPAPLAANLLPIDVNVTATQRFAVDQASLKLGDDGVVRYTMVAVSQQGARNISYEGVRCASRERKLYAIGHPDGKWSQARNSEWLPIVNDAANRQQAALANDFLCVGSAVAGSTEDMLRRIRRHEPLNQEQMR